MSGNNGLGDATGHTVGLTVDAQEDISAGDAVAIDQTGGDGRFPKAVQLNNGSADEDQTAAVAAADISSGDTGPVYVSGPVIANVASSLSQGERLGSGATAGRFASEDGGHALMLSNEGGTDRLGTNLDANEAEVLL
jgi:hypothetical protein